MVCLTLQKNIFRFFYIKNRSKQQTIIRRCMSQNYYPIDENVYGLSEQQKEVRKLIINLLLKKKVE